MVVNKRSKFSKNRGSWTHNGGAKKKRRGAGSRGGRGMAGSGKRGDVNKPSIWNNTKYFGKFGFKFHGVKTELVTINVGWICQNIDTLVTDKVAEAKNDVYTLDLTKTDFNKVLSNGKVNKKLNIKVDYASVKAIEKVAAAGGKIDLPAGEVKKEKVDPKAE